MGRIYKSQSNVTRGKFPYILHPGDSLEDSECGSVLAHSVMSDSL